MATFGKTTVGAEHTTFGGNWKTACRYRLPVQGTITKVTLHTRWSSARAKMLIHADVAGKPGALLGVSDEAILGLAEGDYDFPFSTPIPDAPSGYYWITIKTDREYELYWDAGEVDQRCGLPEPYETILDSFGTPTFYDNFAISIYATYTPTAPPPPEFTLSIRTTEGGTTDPAPGDYSHPEGTAVSVAAQADPSYEFNHWILDGETRTENPIDVIMDRSYTLTAYFTRIVHPLEVRSSPITVPVTVDGSPVGDTPTPPTDYEEGEHTVDYPPEVIT